MAEDRHRPILDGAAATDYERYLRTDELLSLQKTSSEVVHHDEHLFQTIHQSSELWLKLACVEIERATTLISEDAIPRAVRLMRRATDAIDLVIAHLRMLEHISPVDYTVVRTALGHGSGFDSPGFRRVHHVSPQLGAAFTELLHRRGLTVLDVYDRADRDDSLYQLAEALFTWDERQIVWRFVHLKLVERIIGGEVIGTQGTPVDVLGKRIDVRYFPELWTVRDEITRRSPRGADGHASQ